MINTTNKTKKKKPAPAPSKPKPGAITSATASLANKTLRRKR
jgi:hypothetical protein